MSFPGPTPDLPPVSAHGQMTFNAPPTPPTLPPQQQPFKLNRARTARDSSHRNFNISRQEIQERRRRRRLKKRKEEPIKETPFKNFLFKVSLTYFAQRYYGKWLVKTSIKVNFRLFFPDVLGMRDSWMIFINIYFLFLLL